MRHLRFLLVQLLNLHHFPYITAVTSTTCNITLYESHKIIITIIALLLYVHHEQYMQLIWLALLIKTLQNCPS